VSLGNEFSDAISSADKVNVLRGYKREGVMHINILDLSTDYQLVNGEWQELPPF
jgi:hypothetical protein